MSAAKTTALCLLTAAATAAFLAPSAPEASAEADAGVRSLPAQVTTTSESVSQLESATQRRPLLTVGDRLDADHSVFDAEGNEVSLAPYFSRHGLTVALLVRTRTLERRVLHVSDEWTDEAAQASLESALRDLRQARDRILRQRETDARLTAKPLRWVIIAVGLPSRSELDQSRLEAHLARSGLAEVPVVFDGRSAIDEQLGGRAYPCRLIVEGEFVRSVSHPCTQSARRPRSPLARNLARIARAYPVAR